MRETKITKHPKFRGVDVNFLLADNKVVLENICQDILRISNKAKKAPIKAKLKFYSLVTIKLNEAITLANEDPKLNSLPLYHRVIKEAREINETI